MKELIILQMFSRLILMASILFLSDALSLRGKKLDFHGKGNTYVILDNSIPELSRFTACIDLVFMDDVSRNWIAFSYVTTNTFLGREDIDLGLAGNHHYLILYNLGKTYYIHYHLTPFQWYTICLIWDGVKGRLELFLNKERLLVMRDQPQTLRPNGTLVLGNVPRNGEGHIKRVMPSFTGSLYYFQLWDRILENKEFMKCLDGNVVSWEEDAWLIHKIIPTVDKRLRCSVSDNITIQGTSTTLSQQIDLTTPYQVTGLKPQQTLYSSIVMSKSTPVFATDYTAILYSNKTSPPLETVTASKTAQPSIAETPALAVDIASASSAITLPTKSTAIITPKYSMKTSKSLSSQRTVTTKMVEAIASETFHPTSATAFLHTSGFTKNSVVSKTSATRSQADIMKTSLFLSVEPASMSPTSWLTHKSTNNGGFPVSTTGQAFPTAAGTVPWSTVDQTAATTPHTRVVSAVSPETELISTAVPVNSVFPRNQTTSILATSDAERAFTVHSVTLPTRSIETMPSLRTAEIDLTSTNFQAVSSPRVEDDLLTSMPNKASSMALSFKTLSSLTGTQSVQTPTDTETTLTGLTTGVTLSPTVADTILSPTTARPIYTQNIPTVGENMLSLSSTRSVSIGNTSVSGLAPVTNATSHLFSTNSTAWTSKPDQNLLTSVNTSTMLTCMPKEKFTSAFRRVTSHPEHSPTTTNNIITPETSAESKATFAIITTKSRYTTAVSNLISPWFANFSTVSGTTSVPKPSEFNPTTLLPKGPLMSTVAANALLSTPKETAASPEDRKSTLADTKSNYSTKTSSSETTQTETNDTLGFGKATAFVSKSMTTQMPQVTGSRKETASHYFQGRSTTEMTPEVAPFATILEATDGSSQMVTASTTISPSSDMETSSPPVDDKTVATELRSSLMTTSVKTTPRSVSLYSGSSDVFSSTHTYTARWTLKTLPGGNAAPPPSYGSTQPFPELLDVATTGILRTIFTTTPTDRTTMSSSANTLQPPSVSTHFPAPSRPVTHMFSLPVSGSVVVSDVAKVTIPEPSTPTKAFSTSVVSDISTLPSTTVTTASVTTLGHTASMTSSDISTHRDSNLTISEATVISIRTTPMTVSPMIETLAPSFRPPIPLTTKVDSTFLLISSDTVTPSTHTFTSSTSLPDSIPVMSSTHVMTTASIPLTTQSTSQVPQATVLEKCTHALSSPYTLSGGTDSLVGGTTEASIVDEIMTSHTSANKLITSVDRQSSQSFLHLVNTSALTLLVTGTHTVSSDKEHMITLGNTPRTMKASEMSSSQNPFISYSQDTSSLEMTEEGFSETMTTSSHQTHSPSEILLRTLSERNSTTSPTSWNTPTTPTLTSNNKIGTDISEMSTSLRETAHSQAVTVTTFLSPEKESVSALSVDTPRSVEMILRSTSVTHPVSYYKDTSLVDTVPSKTTSLSNSMSSNTTSFHVPSFRTLSKVTSVSSSSSESTQTPLESLSNANFTVTSTDKVTVALSVTNVSTSLLGKSSMAMPIPISQISSMPFNVTVFTSKRVSDTPTIPVTKPSKTTHPSCLKSFSIATSAPLPGLSSLPVNDSAFSTAVVSSDASSAVEPFSALSSAVVPRTTMTTERPTLGVTSVTHTAPTAKGAMVSSAFPTSEMTKLPSRITPTKRVKVTTYLSSNTGKITSLPENTSLTDELTSGATSVNTYPPLIPSIATPLSLTSFLYSPHSTEAEFFTTKTSPVSTSHMVQFPDLGTAITPDNAHSSWNTLAFTNPQFPTSTTAHVPSHDKMETATLLLVPGSLAVVTGSQTDLVSEDVTLKSSTPTSGILPALDLSESPTLSTSSRTILTTFADIKQTVDKITTFVNPGITVTSKPVSITESTVSKAPALPTPIGISSRFPLGSPVATIARDPQLVTSSTAEKSKSTFPTSDMTLTHPFTTFTTLPLPTVDTILTKTTPIPTPITTDFQTSLSMFLKSTDGNMYISTSSGAFPRSTVMANSRTQLPSFNRMNTSPLASDHTLSVGSIPLSSSTVTSSQSSIPAVSVFPTLASPKPTLDSHPNRTTTMTSVTRNSFPLVSIGMTHPFTATVSSLISSSFKPTRLDSTPSFLSRGTLTSTMAAKYSVSFYNIEMNFSFFDGESRIPISSVINEFAKYWLNSIFQDSEFVLANLATQIKSRDTSEEEMTMDRAIWEQREGQGMTPVSRVPYSCVCQVIIKANSSLAPTELINRIKSKIHGNLTHGNFTQDQLTLLVKSEHVAVKILEPGKCKADETASKFKGTYKWLLTNPTEIAQTRCIKNEDGNATRICSINIDTGKSQWEKPKFKQCKLLKGLPDRIMDLANITINDENANDVAEHILNLLSESPPLDEEETKIIVSKVSDISQSDEISMNLTQIILEIISAVLGKQSDSASELNQVRNEILRIIDRVGHKMEFVGRTANLTVARLALAVLRVDRTFEGMTFGIRFYEEGGNPEIYLGEVPLGKILASIYLPKSLKERVPFNNLHTILFNFFGQTSLFKSRTLTKALTTYVVSASISDMSIQNLADPVVITLQHIEGNQNYNQVHCAFWDFEKNNGLGGWNSSGCKVNETNVNYTICQCDHLTHFGVLMDLSRSAVDAVNERILVLITYTGCGISSIFLGIAIVTYVVFHKLRKDYPSKILVNLCTALLMLNMAFLVNSWSASFQKVELCIVAAVALHYFLLVSLTWMGLEAVHMYFALVKVFNIYIPNYIFKFCLVGWGIPAILVAVILSVKKDPYGTLNLVTPFCWIKDDSIFYISVVAYFCLIFILNLSMFCAVLVQLNSMKPQSQKTRRKMILHDLKGTTSLTFLLGLTWGFAFFAWGPVRLLFLYLFAIFNTMQGFLIFVFHCAMKESVRAQWQIHLCCRWFRLDNSSDASSRCGLDVGYKQQRLKKTFEHKLLTLSLESTATNSTLKSSGSTQDILSDMIFPNDDSDDNPYCIFPLSCETVPGCVRRILPVEMKRNYIHKQSFCQ